MSTGTPIEELWKTLMSGVTSTAIGVAAELRIADVLGEQTLPVDAIAKETGAVPARLFRVLRLLASQHIFEEVEPGCFANTDLSRGLQSDHPSSQRDFAVYVRRLLNPGLSEMLHAVSTNETSFEKVFGSQFFDYLSAHAEAGDLFTAAMANSVRLRGQLVDQYAWPESGTIVDVGGADGTLLARVLKPRASLGGVVFDLPHCAAPAAHTFGEQRLESRCGFQSGSFFDENWPEGNVYVLSAILHDWDDDACSRILRNCRRVIPMDGRLVIIDYVLPETGEWHPGKVLDVVMLGLLTGRERTQTEWQHLLGDNGFSISSIIPSSRVSLIEATPATP